MLLILGMMIFSSKESIAQDGIVVINEFNPEKGCSQYIELKNLGPGRQDIGCYKLVNEKYAIAIPPNTFLEPGQIYLIAGTNTIDNCGSIPSIPVNLNWTSCSNCTSVPLTTDAFFAGWENSKSYPLLLYSASNTILDAMRSTANNLATITAPTTNTATSSGAGCSTSTINIPTDISSPSTVYETIGQNLGANATFSRSGDGSCTWYKATSDKRTPGSNNQTESGTATVGATSSYDLTCTTSGYSSTLTITVTSTPYWYQFVFFPNSDPLNGSTPVSQSNNTNQNVAKDDLRLICMMNNEGMVLKEEQHTVRKGMNSFSINTSTLPGGSYYLCTQMVKSGEKQVTRVIKQ